MALEKVVFTSTLDQVSWPNTRISRRDLIDEVVDLKTNGEVPLRTWGSLPLAAAPGCRLGRPAPDHVAADRVPTDRQRHSPGLRCLN